MQSNQGSSINLTETNFLESIKQYKSCLISGHKNSDGDCLGSALSLQEVLKSYLPIVDVVFPDAKIEEKYLFLKQYTALPKVGVQQQKYDLVICVDCGDITRIGDLKKHFDEALLTINIDHHSDNTHYAQINYAKDSSSVGEILFELFEKWSVTLNSKIALFLALSIVTDTGRFRYSNCLAETFMTFSKLRKIGFDFEKLMRELYESQSLRRLTIQKEILNNMVIKGDVAFSFLDREEDDTDGFIELIRSIVGVEVAFFIKPIAGQYKVSLRSKGSKYNVQTIAHKLGGGGHPQASGANLTSANMVLAIQEVLKAI